MRKRAAKGRIRKIAVMGAVLGIVLCGCAGGQEPEKVMVKGMTEVAKAVYPQEPEFKNDDERWDYNKEKRQKMPEEFTDAYRKFAVSTGSELFKGSGENMVYSPLSLYYVLSLAADGADGKTKEEMLSLLGYTDGESLASDCRNSFEAIYHITNEANNKPNEWGEYQTESRYKLTIANSIWADESVSMKKEFAERGAEYYYADLFQGDLQSQETAEAKSAWVKARTNGLILPAAEPAGDSEILSIINTIYFYDEWINRFDKEKTKEDIFTCADGTEVNCDFMNMEMGSQGFRKGENYTESSLSLKNGSMTFFLPDEGVDVHELVKSREVLERVLNGEEEYVSGRVVWKVPKFSYGSNISLADMLMALGMEEAFQESADFGGISETSPLFISSVIQNAHIGIDEEGVEGAAFTEIMFAGAALPTGQAEMILDRPFLYVVENRGMIIFMGICENPAEEAYVP